MERILRRGELEMEEFLHWIWDLSLWHFIAVFGIFVFISAVGQAAGGAQKHDVKLTMKKED